jgi:histidinol phosphatase-like PHP family hydrolase
LTLGSDAHRPGDLGHRLDEMILMAQEAGFKALARFEKRQVVDFVSIEAVKQV